MRSSWVYYHYRSRGAACERRCWGRDKVKGKRGGGDAAHYFKAFSIVVVAVVVKHFDLACLPS